MEAIILGSEQAGAFWAGIFANLMATLIGAMAGAYFAFRFERVKKQNDTIEQHVTEGNVALFVVSEMWQVLRDVQRDPIDRFRDRDDAWLNMPGRIMYHDKSLHVDSRSLAFLFASNDPGVVGELAIQQRNYYHAHGLIERRNRLLEHEIFPALSKEGIARGSQVDDAIFRALREDQIHLLQVTTGGIIRCIDEDVDALKALFHRLRAALKDVFPSEKFIKYSFGADLQSKPDAQRSS